MNAQEIINDSKFTDFKEMFYPKIAKLEKEDLKFYPKIAKLEKEDLKFYPKIAKLEKEDLNIIKIFREKKSKLTRR